ncbi:MAG: hypothetical protein ACE366_31855 [Bradymonadia bacterium]
MSARFSTVCLALAATLTTTSAFAEEPTPKAWQNGEGGNIGEGWVLRLGIGPAWFRGSAEGDGLNSLSVASSGQEAELAIGRSVTDSLLVQGEITWLSVDEPDVEDEVLNTTRRLANGRRLTVIGAGPGLTWNFHRNAYLSGGLHGTVLTVQESVDGTQGEINTDIGLSLHGAIGAQWAFDGIYTLGVTGALTAGTLSGEVDAGAEADWTYLTASLRFTVGFWPGFLGM